MKNLEQLCADALARDADRPAIEYEGHWYTWGQIRHVAMQISRLLGASGIDANAPVSFIPRNRPVALATLLALIAQGRTIRMIYAFQAPTAIARNIATQNSPAVIAGASDFTPEVIDTLRANGIAGIALDEMDAHAVAGCEQSSLTTATDVVARRIEILTSGTTGTPKQFPINFSMIEKSMVGNLVAGDNTDYSQEIPALLYFPLGNITGIYSTLPPLLKGQRVVLLDRFALSQWHDYIVRYRPVATGIPPAAMQSLLESSIPREDLSSLRSMGMGAAPLDPLLQIAFEDRYQIPILLSYGATEFGGPVTAMTLDQHKQFGREKIGSVGRPILGAQLRVIDPQTHAILPAGQEGILEVVAPRMGTDWIRTSDVALIDGDGFLFLRGRADGAIIRGGFKVLPETIERAMLLHPAISAVSIVGVPDTRLGEVPGAAIQIKSSCVQPTPAELETHLRSHLLATHIPVHWRFVDDLPKTPSFKIDRPAVKQLFSDINSR